MTRVLDRGASRFALLVLGCAILVPIMPSYNESRYFLEKNARRREELREKLDTAARRLSDQRAIAKTLKTEDKELVERIHALGFNGDSVRVFDLLPLIHVSWADGQVQHNERATIFSILEERGIEPESDASLLVESLLERRPSETFLGESLDLVRTIAGSEESATLVDLCARVADSSGGLLGFGAKTSDTERDLIAKVAEALGETAQQRFRERYQR
jgi:uncharacterized tellurite resistance protein B-like protein